MKFWRMLAACAALWCIAPAAWAATITINAENRGWYRDDGVGTGGTSGHSYTVGKTGGEFRNWFLFDLTAVGDVTGATLRLFNPSLSGSPGFSSTVNPSETFQVTSVATPISTLTSLASSLAVFNELGTGTLFGSAAVSATSIDAYVDTFLNAAAVTALRETTGVIAFGGRITTLTASPSDTQVAFAFSGILGQPEWAQLRLEVVPEPVGIVLFGVSLAGLALLRQRRR